MILQHPMAAATPPRIPPLRGTAVRPRFSVMVPTFEPDEKLGAALESVLQQAE